MRTDRTVHNNTPDIVMLDKTIKEAYLIDIAICNRHSLYSPITEKFQKYTDLKEELPRIWQLTMVCIIPLVLFTSGIIPHKLHNSLKVLQLHPALDILMQKTVILSTCHMVWEFLAE
jgi:hypothetical protein